MQASFISLKKIKQSIIFLLYSYEKVFRGKLTKASSKAIGTFENPIAHFAQVL